MSEMTKTFIFVVVALAIGVTAYVTRPRPDRSLSEYAEAREAFAPNILPDQIKGLEVSSYDKARNQPDQFSVKLDNGVWVIPSHNNYPADAQERLKKTAGAVLALHKDGVVPGGKEMHKEYGLVDPSDTSGDANSWGTRIKLSDSSGNVVSDLIVGKDVPDKPGFKFVRVADKDRVYQSKSDDLELTTRFADWINTDLITDPSSEFDKIVIHDYKLEQRGNRVRINDKGTVELDKDDKGAWVLQGLKEGEETDPTKATDVANAISDIKILGVRPKPAGLTPELNFLEKQFAAESMISRGFFPTEDGRIVSNEGDVVVETDDGLVYTLRFGGVFLGRGEEVEAGKKDEKVIDPAAKPEEKGEEKKAEGGNSQDTQENRFLLVSVAFDEKKFPPIEPPGEAKPTEQPKEGEKPAEQPKEGDKPAPPAEAKPEQAAPSESKPAEAPPAEPKPEAPKAEAPAEPNKPEAPAGATPEAPSGEKPNIQNVVYQEPTPGEKPAETPAAPAEVKPEQAAPTDNAKPAEQPAKADAPKPEEAAKATEAKPEQATPPADTNSEEAKKAAEFEAQKQKALEAAKAEQAKRDFERRKIERDQKIEAGKKKAKDLEARYGQWFYVVSNEDAMKIRLNRDAFIKKPEAKDAAGQPGAPQGGIPGGFPAGLIPQQPGEGPAVPAPPKEAAPAEPGK
ncbi:DUF4340 domain-containing protein [bacterium]|nr:DUF4340 domain-containing protein [bacterium]